MCCNIFKSWCMSQHRPVAKTATSTQLKHWLNIFPLPCLQRLSVSLLAGESLKEYRAVVYKQRPRHCETCSMLEDHRPPVNIGLSRVILRFKVLCNPPCQCSAFNSFLPWAICFQWDNRSLKGYMYPCFCRKGRQSKSLNTFWALRISYLYTSHLNFEPIQLHL